jgi:hypothetical protein
VDNAVAIDQEKAKRLRHDREEMFRLEWRSCKP